MVWPLCTHSRTATSADSHGPSRLSTHSRRLHWVAAGPRDGSWPADVSSSSTTCKPAAVVEVWDPRAQSRWLSPDLSSLVTVMSASTSEGRPRRCIVNLCLFPLQCSVPHRRASGGCAAAAPAAVAVAIAVAAMLPPRSVASAASTGQHFSTASWTAVSHSSKSSTGRHSGEGMGAGAGAGAVAGMSAMPWLSASCMRKSSSM